MFFLATLARSTVLEITKDNLNLLGGERPIFVKFFRTNCPHCRNMAEAFEEASTMFKDVDFGGINCEEQNSICDTYKIEGVPTIVLYGAKNSTGKPFEGHERSADGFADFIEETIQVKALRPPKIVKELSPVNYNNSIAATKCSLVTYYAPYCGHCKRWLPQKKALANAFIADNNTVSFLTVNCEKFHSLCENANVQGYPTIKLYMGEKIEEYNSDRSPETVANFINTHCGTQRGADGLLVDSVGVIPEAEEAVKEFITAEDKAAAIEKVKILPQSNLYVTFMERIVKNGIEKSKEDLGKIKTLLDERKASYKVLDNLKTRYNVFATVLGERLPKETPAPEPTTPEAETVATEEKKEL